MIFRRGSKVWTEDKGSAWIEAEVVDVKDKLAVVATAIGKKITVPLGKLLPRDPDADHGGVDDMTKLTYLHEPGVLYNLARRYSLNEIYTYTGCILVAVNPFTMLPHLYNGHMMEQYKRAKFGELSPHVFAIADASYRSMINESRNQSILVSGESGAGKTETTKLIMQYLTYVGGRVSADDRTVEQQVLESNPLLEAFGNARTVRNDNSSRFGKFVEIQFDRSGRISGAAIRTYLLERSRVVQTTDPERNYHCFYQLCASRKDAEKYNLGHPSSFHYLNQSKTYELDGVNSAQEFVKTCRAMDIVGISLNDKEAIFRTLAAILHLGNITFSPGKDHDSSIIKDSKSDFHLQMAATLFMCDRDHLLESLCTRSIQTHEGCIVKAVDVAAASASRDTLAKTVYARLFDWLVETINKSVGQDPDPRFQIGLLDIYGFECFKNNSFEQFCINFANEKLQQHFNEHVFKMEQEEYRNEEIDWSYIEFIDNQDVLDLIEKKPIGIISLLDEACMFPKSTGETFSTKLFQSFPAHSRLEKAKFFETDFTISHYAGKVTYQTDSFLDKNRDYVVVDHRNLLFSSKCSFVSGLFTSLPEESSRSSYKFSSVAARFKQQLQALMETLNSTQPHFVRCVKPNSLNRPQKFENQSVLHQLRCGGVLEAIRISLAGYPTRKTYSEFLDRYGLLTSELIDGSYDEKKVTERILRNLKLENFQIGRTKVFLRAGQIAVLDSRRGEVLDKAARLIQGRYRTYTAHKEYLKTRNAAIILEAYCRGTLARNIFASNKRAAATVVIQRYARRWMLRRAFLHAYSAVLVIQSSIRSFFIRQRFMCMKEHRAAMLIQAYWRMRKAYMIYHHQRSGAVCIQCAWRQKLGRRELRRLKQAANETGALRKAKTNLEKKLEDLTLRLTLEKRIRVTGEESKSVEISRLHDALESLKTELAATKLATSNERNEKSSLQCLLDKSMQAQVALQSNLMELNKENLYLKKAMESLEKRNSELEYNLQVSQKNSHDTLKKLQDVEAQNVLLKQNLHSLEEKVSNLEEVNLILRQKDYTGAIMLSSVSQKSIFETPPPSKYLAPVPYSLSESRLSKKTVERHEENCELLMMIIKEDLGFKDGKPVAACILYKCLLHWHAFEAERTTIFEYIIGVVNDALKVDNGNDILPYWLSNASAFLCLLQRNIRSNSFFTTPTRRSAGSLGLSGTMALLKSPRMLIGQEDGVSHVEARYPALLFKQQLTACLEKIFGLIRDNLKKDLSPLLNQCIQAPKIARAPAGRNSKSPGNGGQQPLNNHWDSITKFLDSLVIRLRQNYVPSFFIRKLITQVFSFINNQLFNSLLLRRECCTFSNGEYVKSGLAVLEKWIADVKEEFAGTSWHELSYIRQAVGFLVIHQKRRKTLEEIMHDLCPALSVQQVYRICTMYWDDKYGTESVSKEVVAMMREMINKATPSVMSNSFLLDDDLSIPFVSDDISKAISAMDLTDVELPPHLARLPAAHFLLNHPGAPPRLAGI